MRSIIIIALIAMAACNPIANQQCPSGYTDCPTPSGDVGCCPYEGATCCDDKVHCCPANTKCNLSAGTCEFAQQGNDFLAYAGVMERVQVKTPSIGDIIKCVEAASPLVADVKQLIADFQKQDIAAVEKDLETILADGTKAFEVCKKLFDEYKKRN